MTARGTFKAAVAFALAALFVVPAVSGAAEIRPVFVAGYDTGGDKLVTVTFTNGDSESIRANEGLYVGGGISVLNDDKNIEFVGTVNYKYQSVSADNGDVTWTRIPIDTLVFYRMQSFRFGGGLTFQLSPKLKGSGAASNINTNVDNAVGLLLQADYLLGKVNIGVRGTLVDFKSGGATAKGNGVGITFGITF
jgi:hypothetical protein